MARGPGAGARLFLPGGTLCSCQFSAACDPLASAARKGKRRGLPRSLSKGFSPLEGPRRETEQSPIYFDKKLQFPAEKRHPLTSGPRRRPTFTRFSAPPAPSSLFSGWSPPAGRESLSSGRWHRVPYSEPGGGCAACRVAAAPHSHYPIHHAQPQPVWAGPRLPDVRGGREDRGGGLSCSGEPRGLLRSLHRLPVAVAQAVPCCCQLTPEGDGGERGSPGDVGKREPAAFIQGHTRTHAHTLTHSQTFSYKFMKPNLLSANL